LCIERGFMECTQCGKDLAVSGHKDYTCESCLMISKKEELRQLFEARFPKQEAVEPDPRDNMKPDELAKYEQSLKDKQAMLGKRNAHT
jgi:hypothetical protein